MYLVDRCTSCAALKNTILQGCVLETARYCLRPFGGFLLQLIPLLQLLFTIQVHAKQPILTGIQLTLQCSYLHAKTAKLYYILKPRWKQQDTDCDSRSKTFLHISTDPIHKFCETILNFRSNILLEMLVSE